MIRHHYEPLVDTKWILSCSATAMSGQSTSQEMPPRRSEESDSLRTPTELWVSNKESVPVRPATASEVRRWGLHLWSCQKIILLLYLRLWVVVDTPKIELSVPDMVTGLWARASWACDVTGIPCVPSVSKHCSDPVRVQCRPVIH